MTAPDRPVTAGALLNGSVRYDQHADGYRTGIEPVLLAAAVPARPGQLVLEAGSGAGAGLLCLARRVPGVAGIGVERDPALATLAAANARANGWGDRLSFHAASIEHFTPPARCDHAFANPPWHAQDGTCSPNPGRAGAKRAAPGLLAGWSRALTALVRDRGTISLILPAGQLHAGLAALAGAGCGGFRLLPVWPRAGVAARLLIISARRGGRGATVLSAGLVLHESDGAYTPAAEAILRGAAALAV